MILTGKPLDPAFDYIAAPFGYSIRARFFGAWVHVMTVLSESLARETVELYENGSKPVAPQ